MTEKGLSKEEMDFVNEMASIGAGNAATALSQMLGCDVGLSVPKVHFLSHEEVPSIFDDLSRRAIVAKIGFVGDIKGDILYAVKEGDVREFVHLIEKTFPVDERAGIPEISVMEETANIITGVYLSAIGNICGLNVTHTIPVVSATTFHALIDEIRAKAVGLVAIINEITVADRRIISYLLVTLSVDALKILSLRITEARRRLEIKELEENIVRGKVEFHAVVETASDAIICMEPPGEIYLWNRKAEEMFGYPVEEVVGKDVHSLIVPEGMRERVAAGLKTFFETGTGPVVGKTVELSGLRKDGSEFPVELSISAMRVGDAWHATGIIRDITERKKAEERIKRHVEELERFKKATIQRELRMKELRDRLEDLEKGQR